MSYLPLLAALLPSVLASGKIYFFVGTYTSEQGSKGIYSSSIDARTGQLSEPVLAAEASNPSYVAFKPGQRFLYAVHENDEGSVSAYKVLDGHSLQLINTRLVPGGAPCDLSVDPTGKNLLVASYMGGMISCLPLTASGGLGEPSAHLKNEGAGPNHVRQDASHMHWIQADSKSKFVYTCDLGTDKVQVYRFLPGNGSFTPLPDQTGRVIAGEGPRHGAFSLNHQVLYVNAEMGNSVTAFHVDGTTGGLKPFQTVSTLKTVEENRGITGAEIELHPGGKWLFVSNRGDDSITQFKVDGSGTLKLVELTKLPVKMPRGFAIDPSGHWLVVGGQDSNDLASYAIDSKTGKLQKRSYLKGIGKPVCILFAAG